MAKVSPLAKYRELAKAFGMTGKDKEEPDDRKIYFANEQTTQMKIIAGRLLYDLATTYVLLESAQDPTTKSAYLSKINQLENDLRSTSAALDAGLLLIKELETV